MTTERLPSEQQMQRLAINVLRIMMRESQMRHLNVNPDNVLAEAEHLAGIEA